MSVSPVVRSPLGRLAVMAIGGAFLFAFCWAADPAFRATIDPLFRRIAGIGFGGIKGHLATYPFRFLNGWADTIERWINSGKALGERTAVNSFGSILWWAYDLAFTITKIAYDTNTQIDNIWARLTRDVPHAARVNIARPLERAMAKARAYTDSKIKSLDHRVDALADRVAKFAGDIAIPLPRSLPHIPRLDRDIANLWKKVRGASWLLKYASLGALATAVLLRLKLGFLRCDRNKQFGKKMCKTNPWWLDDFFLGTVAVIGATSVVEFVKDAQKFEDVALESVQFLIRELKDLELDRAKAAAAGFATSAKPL